MFVKLIESPGRVVAQPSMTKFQGWHPIQLRDWQAHWGPWDSWKHPEKKYMEVRSLRKTYVLCFEPLRNMSKYIILILVVIDTLKPVLEWSFEPTENIWTLHKQILDATRAASQPTGAGTVLPGHLRSIEWEWMVPISSRKLMISCAILTPFNLFYIASKYVYIYMYIHMCSRYIFIWYTRIICWCYMHYYILMLYMFTSMFCGSGVASLLGWDLNCSMTIRLCCWSLVPNCLMFQCSKVAQGFHMFSYDLKK